MTSHPTASTTSFTSESGSGSSPSPTRHGGWSSATCAPTWELTAGNLSQHLSVLESAGLITIEKGYAGKRARTWITLTRAGRIALREEITQLKLLINQIERTDTTQH
jgi:DNA-binding PadR family transcriptional regulator